MSRYQNLLTRRIQEADRLAQLDTVPDMMKAYYRGISDGLRDARAEHIRQEAEQPAAPPATAAGGQP